MKILVVDDELSMLTAMSRLLRTDGHEVCLAPDGQGALDLLEREHVFGVPVRLVLLDVNLGPGLDGLDVAQRMREHPIEAISSCAVFFVSGESPSSVQRRARSAASAKVAAVERTQIHISKPVDWQTLRRAIALVPTGA
jgi:CheY-like chemotaxis protein